MANGVNELIDQLYTMVSDARGLPLTAEKCVLERDKLLDLLDEIKLQLPAEVAEAKRLMANRTEYINTAKAEAEKLKQGAEEHARRLIDEETVVRAAKARAEDILRAADSKANELRKAANAYADEALHRTENALAKSLEEVRGSRASFRAAAEGLINFKKK